MPFLDERLPQQRTPLGDRLTTPEQATPSLGETAGAAFRQVSPVGSVAAAISRSSGFVADDPDYDPIEDLKGTPYERDHADRFFASRSQAETESIKAKIDAELQDRETLGAAGIPGFVVALGMGLIDPTIALPGGALYRGIKGGVSIGRTALSVGTAGFVQGVAAESILAMSQETSTREEFMIGVGASTILSGLLGGGAAALVTRSERAVLKRALQADRDVMTGVGPEVLPQHISDPANMNVAMGSVGAAASDSRIGLPAWTPVDRLFRGVDATPGVRAVLGSPTQSLMRSELQASRRVVGDLAESGLMTVDAERGVTPTRFGGPSAEREIKMTQRQTLVALDDAIEDAWVRHSFGSREAAPMGARIRDAIGEATGRTREGKLSFGRFDEEVGRAMRSGDRHEIAEVAEVARWVRQNVFEPWKERAIEAGMFPEGVDVKTAESYFMRSYNREAMKEKSKDFVGRTTDWLESEQSRKREIQTKIEALDAQRREVTSQLGKIEARIARADNRLTEMEGRTAERDLENRRVAGREEVLADRVADQEAELSELAEAVAALRAQSAAPELRERIAQLEGEVRALQREERAARLSPEDLDKIRKQEEDGYLADDFHKKFAEMVVGRRNPPKKPTLTSYFVQGGGIVDDGGEVRSLLGGDSGARPGLLNRKGLTVDEWGEKLWEEFPYIFPERPARNDVLDILSDSLAGNEPYWFVEARMLPDDLDLARAAEDLPEVRAAMERNGYATDNRRDVARFMLDMREAEPAGPGRFDDGAPIPPSVAGESAEAALGRELDRVSEIRGAVERARSREGRVETARGRDAARLSEVEMGQRAGGARTAELDRQTAAVARRRAVQEEAMAIAREQEAAVYRAMEAELEGWGGKSARDALSAVRSRDKAATGRDPDAARLRGADSAVLASARRILGSDRQMDRMELQSRAQEIYDRIISTPDGRLPYDEAPASGGGGSSGRDAPRGALASREFMIPDQVLDDLGVLDNSALRGSRGFMHSTVPDVVLTEKFGDFNLTNQVKAIQEEAHAAVSANPARSREIMEKRDRDIKALTGIRDRIRGTFAQGGDATTRTAGRVGSFLRYYNMAADLGGATVSSVPDLGNAVFRWGLTTVLNDAWRPFFKGLVGMSDGWKRAKEQYRAMGIGVEMALLTRSRSMNDISSSYRPESGVERTMATIGEASQVLNLQAQWTDATKTIASIVSGNDILRATKAVAAGRATPKQIRDLAASGIDQNLARRVFAEFERGGEIVDGVHLPNTADWQDRAARRAFEGAVGRESDIMVVTPGEEKPLWMSQPIVGLLGQHKSFIMGATERILLANLQRRDANTLQGALMMLSLGMVSAGLYSVFSGKGFPERPQDWVKEGLSRSGMLGWLDEVNSMTAMATRGGIDGYRLVGADKPLQRFSSRSALERVMGPSAGKFNTAIGLTGAPFGEEGWTARDTANLRRMAPYQNLFYLRRLLNEVEDATNETLGIQPLPNR
jgi:hypothetical protein